MQIETAVDTRRVLHQLLEQALISLPALTHMGRSCERHRTLNTKAELETGHVGTYPGVMRMKVQSWEPLCVIKGNVFRSSWKVRHDRVGLNFLFSDLSLWMENTYTTARCCVPRSR